MSYSYESVRRIKHLISATTKKTGYKFNNLTSAIQELCMGYKNPMNDSSVVPDEILESGGHLKALLSFINKGTGINHTNITSAVQTLINGYEAEPSVLLYSFGAVSDTHIQYGGTEEDGDYNGVNDFERALTYLDDKVDFICLSGDLVAWASADYMAEYKSKITDSTLTTKPIYECAGNHETYPAKSTDGVIDKAMWENTIGWANHQANGCIGDSLYYYFTKGDDIFIMLSLVDVSPYAAFAEGALDWLENVLETNRNKRCFVFQHVHDENDSSADPSHCYSNMLNGADGAQFIKLMKHYKNAIWFHGHTHLSITTGLDENGYKIDNYDYTPIFTELGYKSVHVPSLQGVRYYNPGSGGLVNSYKYYGTDGKTYETQGGQHAEGYIVDVYSNKIVVRGIDFAVLKYTADWKAYYEAEPMSGKQFTMNTKLQTITANTFTN